MTENLSAQARFEVKEDLRWLTEDLPTGIAHIREYAERTGQPEAFLLAELIERDWLSEEEVA